MSDELPTEDRLRRIERGVQRRIDARRATLRSIRRGVTGGIVTVLLIGGGFALLRPTAGTSTASSAGGSGASAGGSGASAPFSTTVPVTCHEGASTTTTTSAARSTLPGSALRACTAAAFAAEGHPNAAGGTSASPTATPTPRVLCRAEDGALHVYLGAAAVCSAHGMTAYRG